MIVYLPVYDRKQKIFTGEHLVWSHKFEMHCRILKKHFIAGLWHYYSFKLIMHVMLISCRIEFVFLKCLPYLKFYKCRLSKFMWNWRSKPSILTSAPLIAKTWMLDFSYSGGACYATHCRPSRKCWTSAANVSAPTRAELGWTATCWPATAKPDTGEYRLSCFLGKS